MMSPSVSGISESRVNLPFSFGIHQVVDRGDLLADLLGVRRPRPVKPDCHGMLISRFGSHVGAARAGCRFFAFGIAALSSFST
jgi:hypothetical protein